MKNFLIKVAFSFVLFLSCTGHAHAQLVSGTSENGSITTPGGSASYTFTASAGEGVLLYGEASYSVRIRIYKPDSTLWTSKVIQTREQFAKHIDKIINNPTATRSLSQGRTAYWDEASGTVVIRNPRAADGGTAFRPVLGRKYFDDILR